MKLADSLSASAVAATLRTADRESRHWADDLAFQLLAQHEWGANGIATTDVLFSLVTTGNITDEEYSAALSSLIRAGYRFVSVRWEDMFAVLDRNEWRPTDEV